LAPISQKAAADIHLSEFARYVQIAMGSASELEYHLLLARDLELLTDQNYQALQFRLSSVRKMLTALQLKLREGPSDPATAEKAKVKAATG
jgi:four helix bundle protein